MSAIAFVGLGIMGGPMARHLVKAGHDVVGHNRSPEKAEATKAPVRDPMMINSTVRVSGTPATMSSPPAFSDSASAFALATTASA